MLILSITWTRVPRSPLTTCFHTCHSYLDSRFFNPKSYGRVQFGSDELAFFFGTRALTTIVAVETGLKQPTDRYCCSNRDGCITCFGNFYMYTPFSLYLHPPLYQILCPSFNRGSRLSAFEGQVLYNPAHRKSEGASVYRRGPPKDPVHSWSLCR